MAGNRSAKGRDQRYLGPLAQCADWRQRDAFVGRIEKSDKIIVIGTQAYRRKYENQDTKTGYVVAAEVDLINKRLLGTEKQKESVLPLLGGRGRSSFLTAAPAGPSVCRFPQ